APETVEVLHLDDGSGNGSSALLDVQVDVCVTAQASLLHVAVRNLQIRQQEVQFLKKQSGLGSGTEVRFGDDLQQRGAAPVQVDQPLSASPGFIVQVLARVFLAVCAVDADLSRR